MPLQRGLLCPHRVTKYPQTPSGISPRLSHWVSDTLRGINPTAVHCLPSADHCPWAPCTAPQRKALPSGDLVLPPGRSSTDPRVPGTAPRAMSCPGTAWYCLVLPGTAHSLPGAALREPVLLFSHRLVLQPPKTIAFSVTGRRRATTKTAEPKEDDLANTNGVPALGTVPTCRSFGTSTPGPYRGVPRPPL